MNKSDLIAAAAQRTGLSKKDTEKMLGAVLDIIAESLSRGEKVQLNLVLKQLQDLEN